MATISITVRDEVVPLLLDACALVYGWQAQVPDPDDPTKVIPNPVTKAEFARNCLIQHAKEVMRAYRFRLAQQQAEKDSAKDVL